jgi:3-dehydroquinate dehydratase type I
MSRICVSIVETTVGKALGAIREANRLADLIELRIDCLKEPRLDPLMTGRKRPFVVTCRPKEERGKYSGDEDERFGILKEAIALGAEYVDIEMRSERGPVKALIANKGRSRIILSFHDHEHTPPRKELTGLFDRMHRMGADIVKIVTHARSWEDNLTLLSLIPFARGRKQEILAFCMGGKGKMSRVFSPLMGGAWTYASLRKNRVGAPGQLTVPEMKRVWETLR